WWMYSGSSSPHSVPADPTWSKWPCVARTATGRFPAASSMRRTTSGENPGSTTTASSEPSAASSQQLVSNGLSKKTSRYIGRPSYRVPPVVLAATGGLDAPFEGVEEVLRFRQLSDIDRKQQFSSSSVHDR